MKKGLLILFALFLGGYCYAVPAAPKYDPPEASESCPWLKQYPSNARISRVLEQVEKDEAKIREILDVLGCCEVHEFDEEHQEHVFVGWQPGEWGGQAYIDLWEQHQLVRQCWRHLDDATRDEESPDLEARRFAISELKRILGEDAFGAGMMPVPFSQLKNRFPIK